MERVLNYGYLYLIPLTISAVCSLKSFRWQRQKSLKIFSALLLFTLSTEALAILWKWQLFATMFPKFSTNNLWIYNLSVIGRHMLMVAFFYHLLNSPLKKKLIMWSLPVFLSFSILNFLIFQGPLTLNTYSIVVASSCTAIMVLLYFNQLLHDQVLIELHRSPTVLISLGTFLYYSGTLPLFIFFNYLVTKNQPLLLSYLNINDTLNILMYVFYLIAFLWKAPSLK